MKHTFRAILMMLERIDPTGRLARRREQQAEIAQREAALAALLDEMAEDAGISFTPSQARSLAKVIALKPITDEREMLDIYRQMIAGLAERRAA